MGEAPQVLSARRISACHVVKKTFLTRHGDIIMLVAVKQKIGRTRLGCHENHITQVYNSFK